MYVKQPEEKRRALIYQLEYWCWDRVNLFNMIGMQLSAVRFPVMMNTNALSWMSRFWLQYRRSSWYLTLI